MKLPFTEEESETAHDTWGANCGPHSVAVALMLSLDQVHPLFAPKFDETFRTRGYGFTNLTMMGNALALARVPFQLEKNLKTQDLREGICRIQWEGPWLKPGVPPIVAYGHTHWIACTETHVFCTAIPLFDFDCDYGWVTLEVWRNLIEVLCVREKFSGWHITHRYAFPVRAKETA